MRRALATLGLVIFALCAFPSRADAYFWWWLDDLSGPSYKGWQVEWQVWCRTEDARMTPAFLRAVANDLKLDDWRYEYAKSQATVDSDSFKLLVQAVERSGAAKKSIADAQADAAKKEFDSSARKLSDGLREWEAAERFFQDGMRAKGHPEEEEAIAAFAPNKYNIAAATGGAGFTVSLCSAAPFQRTNRFVALTFGWAGEYEKYEDRLSAPAVKRVSRDAELRLITLGVAFHSVVKPYLTIGAEAGLASFSSKHDPAFQKLYVKPVVVDVVPLALGRHPNLGSPWRHVIHVRGFYTVFPTGFKEGSFTFDDGSQSEQFRAEMLGGWGLDFDLTPLIRKWQGKW